MTESASITCSEINYMKLFISVYGSHFLPQKGHANKEIHLSGVEKSYSISDLPLGQ